MNIKKIMFAIIMSVLFLTTGCSKAKYFKITSKNADIALTMDPGNKFGSKSSIDARAISNLEPISPKKLFAEKNGQQFATISDIHKSTPGDISVEKTYGYSFYIVNKSSDSDVTASVKLTMKNDKGLSDVIRVMTYYEASGVQNIRVYQKEDKEEVSYADYSIIESRNALKFFDDESVIFDTNKSNENITISGNEGSNYIRYTILFWVEENDPDCNEKVLKNDINFKLEIDKVA